MDSIEYTQAIGKIVQAKLEAGDKREWRVLVAEASHELKERDDA